MVEREGTQDPGEQDGSVEAAARRFRERLLQIIQQAGNPPVRSWRGVPGSPTAPSAMRSQAGEHRPSKSPRPPSCAKSPTTRR